MQNTFSTAPNRPESRLLPDTVKRLLPRWRATANESDPVAMVKFFLPETGWTWYVVEFDGDDTCFGLVAGLEVESGYFSIQEIEEARSPRMRLLVERDLHFTPTRLSALREMHAARV